MSEENKKDQDPSDKKKSPEEKMAELISSFTDEDQRIIEETFGKQKLTAKVVYRYCKRNFGIEDDELKLTYPREEDLLKFFLEILKKSNEDDFMTAVDDNSPQDTYELTEDNQVTLADVNLRDKRKRRKDNAELADMGLLKQPEQDKIPSDLPLSWEEVQRELREGFGFDED